nr:unnamed protein product [Callosobruchus chinensis]
MSLSKPYENNLQNVSQIVRNPNGLISSGRTAPVLPPRPLNSPVVPVSSSGYAGVNSYMPYSGLGGYGSYNSYGSYGMPYRSSMYGSFGGYSGYNSYGGYQGGYGGYTNDDHERRFIQYAEESSRNTFANVESIVRAVNSLAMMLDNTFFAMTSSFRAVLSVAENFGRLRSMFAHIWHSINIFRFITWLYRKMKRSFGYNVPQSMTSAAWRQAASSTGVPAVKANGSGWSILAFLGMLISAPYIISKFLPKFEDKGDPANWKSPGIRAKAIFDFIATGPTELTIQTNDMVMLAPTYIQEELNLKNTGWAYAVCKGKAGVVPLNYLVISKARPVTSNPAEDVPVPIPKPTTTKTHTKRVSFGENQIFENVDIDDYVMPKRESSQNSAAKKEEKVESSGGDKQESCEESKSGSSKVVDSNDIDVRSSDNSPLSRDEVVSPKVENGTETV